MDLVPTDYIVYDLWDMISANIGSLSMMKLYDTYIDPVIFFCVNSI